jgi:hypothetical protein
LQGEGMVKMAMAHFDPYGISWSRNGRRFGVSSNGRYVAGYDLATGTRIKKNETDTDRTIADFLKE